MGVAHSLLWNGGCRGLCAAPINGVGKEVNSKTNLMGIEKKISRSVWKNHLSLLSPMGRNRSGTICEIKYVYLEFSKLSRTYREISCSLAPLPHGGGRVEGSIPEKTIF